MPTMTAIALQRLLEPDAGRSSSPSPSPKKPSAAPFFFSPALYATPDPAPIPDSSSPLSVSPSPYLINRKGRRGARPTPAPARVDGFEIRPTPHADQGAALPPAGEGRGTVGVDAEWSPEGLLADGTDGAARRRDDELDGDDDTVFFDPLETRSVASSNSGGGTLMTLSEYYDAAEDFSLDGSVSHSSPSFSTKMETELRTLKLNLLEEIGRRKFAEQALLWMHNQWQRMAVCLSQVEVSLREIQQTTKVQLETDPAALCQELVVLRLVSIAVERLLARVEAEAAVEEVIDAKNHEISRLRDRLQYYEAVNREMSHRNQEVLELARKKRLKKRTKQRWMWSCVGLSISIGASLLVHSYLPSSAKGPSPTSCPDCPSGTVSSGEN